MREAWVRLIRSREWPKASSRSIGGAPGPSGGGPAITDACHCVSDVLSTAAIRPSRLSKRRNSVPLPTPASDATVSIVTQSTPRVSTRRSAAARMASRLRAASARSGAGSSASGSSRFTRSA